jgi:hypothetical protein
MIVVGLLLAVNTSFGQEIGLISNANNYIKLVKSEQVYSLIYSNNDIGNQVEKQLVFSDLDKVYAIIMKGFEEIKDHQVIIKMSKDTIVKFDFKQVHGTKMLMIQQNNLTTNSYSKSSFFSKEEFHKLFSKG